MTTTTAPSLDELTTPLRRESDRQTFVGRLAAARNAAVDVVAPQAALHFEVALDGDDHEVTLSNVNGEPILLPDGVADHLDARLTRTAFRQIGERLRIPVPFMDRLAAHDRREARMLLDDNINTLSSVDDRSALYRYWRGSDGWMLRALLSDRYAAIDNFDALRAIGAGMAQADASLDDAEVDVDLSADRFRLRIAMPTISHAAPDLLDGYRSPFEAPGTPLPVLWAGLEFTNSETGHGAFAVAPRAVVQICRNGMTRPVEFRRAHFGSALEEGVVDWSADTRRRALDLITSQVADAVATFMSTDYLERLADEMRAARGVRVESPSHAVEAVARSCELSDDETRSVADMFFRSGESTVLGLGHAITAAAQTVPDGDRQTEMESMFWRIVERPADFAGVTA